jgi:putrescine transport system permease protein
VAELDAGGGGGAAVVTRLAQRPPVPSAGGVVSSTEALSREAPPLSALGLATRLLVVLERHGRALVIAAAFLWLIAFFLVPFAIILKISLSEPMLAQPPYAPVFDVVDQAGAAAVVARFNLGNYQLVLSDPLYVRAYLGSVAIAAVATLLTAAIGLPMAYGMAKAPQRWRAALVMAVILPFWTSFLIRVYAWIGILKPEGLLNALLMALGVIDEPLVILGTPAAIHIGIVYSYLPFMVLPIFASLDRMDGSLVEAAVDLGCRPVKAFWVITVPMAMPGIVAGSLLVFIPAVGEFVIPDLLGGAETVMIGRVLWVEFFNNRDWPLASAVAVLLLLVLVVPIVLFQRAQERARQRGAAA